MNSNLGHLVFRRTYSSSYMTCHIIRNKPALLSFVNKNPLRLQNIGPAIQCKAQLHKAISKYIVDPHGQSSSRSHSTNLPLSDTNLDARKLHNIFQFGIAVQQILPSK